MLIYSKHEKQPNLSQYNVNLKVRFIFNIIEERKKAHQLKNPKRATFENG